VTSGLPGSRAISQRTFGDYLWGGELNNVHDAHKQKGYRVFERFAWGVVGYNLLVILWGAYVRVSGSGAGCGAHWPSCNGEIIPTPQQVETVIEFIHRLMSGLTLVLSLVLVVWAWRIFAKGHPARSAAGFALLFTCTEALVGAGLVLFGLVNKNVSVTRAVVQAVHLINTLLLVASCTLAAWWAAPQGRPRLKLTRQGLVGWLLWVALVWMVLLSASGAVTALGDTIFPSQSLAQGLSQDMDPMANFLIRLRVVHPVLAILLTLYTGWAVSWIRDRRQGDGLQKFGRALTGLVILQAVLGALNIILLAPAWMQLVHLLVSDLAWIGLVLFSVSVFEESRAPQVA
jgi:heme A synthase